MKIDVQIPMQLPVPAQLAFVQRVEDMGFDGAGLPDHMENGRDVYTVLALAADRTKSIQLFPCVSNPVTRHPWVLANIAHTFEEMAPGRFKLVIGAGDSAVLHVGKRPAKVAELRDAVTGIQGLLRGQTVRFGDRLAERIDGIEGPQPPVVVAAGGPRVTELAGEIGDEGFLLTGFDERILAMVKRQMDAGAARSGRSLDGFKLSHYTLVRIESDLEAAAEFARSRLLGWLKMSFFKDSLLELEVDPQSIAEPERIPNDVMAKLADAFFLIGPIEKIAERLQQVSKGGGLDRMTCVVSAAGQGPEEALDSFARRVMPAVK